MSSSGQLQLFSGAVFIVLKLHKCICDQDCNLTMTSVDFYQEIILSQKLEAEVLFHTKSVLVSFLPLTEVILIS